VEARHIGDDAAAADFQGRQPIGGTGRGNKFLPNTTDWLGRFRLAANPGNDWGMDRAAQRSNAIYSGIDGIHLQDQAITESMGPITDHAFEHLAPSDQMITRTRRRLLMAARALRDKGVLPPGVDAAGRQHVARQYSLSSPRDGERRGYNNIALTVKRVTADHAGVPVRGVCSNYLCDLAKGDTVQVIGPFGNTFLMPDHPRANLLMICTGTGSAPMRAMTERRRRLRANGDGKLMLFFGARTVRELPYFGPLMNLPRDFIDINLAFSRMPDAPKRYVQDLMRERGDDVAALLESRDTHVYVCGLKSMEQGVLDALRAVCEQRGVDWNARWRALKSEGRLHFETY